MEAGALIFSDFVRECWLYLERDVFAEYLLYFELGTLTVLSNELCVVEGMMGFFPYICFAMRGVDFFFA